MTCVDVQNLVPDLSQKGVSPVFSDSVAPRLTPKVDAGAGLGVMKLLGFRSCQMAQKRSTLLGGVSAVMGVEA